jgi:hypothetical protein
MPISCNLISVFDVAELVDREGDVSEAGTRRKQRTYQKCVSVTQQLTAYPGIISSVDCLITAKVPPHETGISLFNLRARCAFCKV